MRIGVNLLLWTTQVGREHLPVLRALKSAGHDGVEVPVFRGSPSAHAETGRMLAGEGLAATVVGIVQEAARNPMSPDPAARAAGIDDLKRLVDCSVAMGAEVLCRPFTRPLATFSGRGPMAAERVHLVAAHRAVADHAGGALRLAVEPVNRFECYALNTVADAARLVAEVGRPDYGRLCDTFHANIEKRDPAGAIRAGGGAIAHVHSSETGAARRDAGVWISPPPSRRRATSAMTAGLRSGPSALRCPTSRRRRGSGGRCSGTRRRSIPGPWR